MMKTETKKEITKTIFETPTYHRGRSLEEQQERHRVGTGHTRVGKLHAILSKTTKMYHIFQECLDCSNDEIELDTRPSPDGPSREHLETLDKKQLLLRTGIRGLPGNPQSSKTKLIDTILKSY